MPTTVPRRRVRYESDEERWRRREQIRLHDRHRRRIHEANMARLADRIEQVGATRRRIDAFLKVSAD